ncbi:hypothetical protein OXPF_41800 [Oxobacter pfennigii]|uniref:Spo0E like sporulation regulatory protein n=1 Tax=Oxobacter pfennigii TaxID=36849 RepID=A0A0P8W4I5_9CLOT|nr:hypothetical protein OXPF_41800 [Oxobacter pfennigii]
MYNIGCCYKNIKKKRWYIMKLIDEIKVLQEELNSIVNENSNDMSRLINLSEKLDKLIAQYYSETQNK